MKNKNEIVEKLCDLYGEQNEKKKKIKILMQRLINSWKEEDLKNPNKLICNLCLKNSKILKLDENNQYGFAMTKPLLIGIFKEKNM